MNEIEITLDKVDYSILRLMQDNARIANVDLARELNMAPSAVLERVKKLEQKKVILTRQFRLPAFVNGSASGMEIEACAIDRAHQPLVLCEVHAEIADRKNGGAWRGHRRLNHRDLPHRAGHRPEN